MAYIDEAFLEEEECEDMVQMAYTDEAFSEDEEYDGQFLSKHWYFDGCSVTLLYHTLSGRSQHTLNHTITHITIHTIKGSSSSPVRITFLTRAPILLEWCWGNGCKGW